MLQFLANGRIGDINKNYSANNAADDQLEVSFANSADKVNDTYVLE